MFPGSPLPPQPADFSKKTRALLNFGCHQFGLEIGALLRTGELYPRLITAVVPSENGECRRAVLAIQKVRWEDLFPTGAAVYFNEGNTSEWAPTPWVKICRLEACLAWPVWAFEQVFGVLVFAHRMARPLSFQPHELEEMRLMTERIGCEVEREALTRDLQEANLIRRTQATQLAEAQSLAHEVDRLKSEFLMTLSHEIRTPMNAIGGLSDLLLKTPLEPEQKDFVLTIRSASQALLHLFNQMLDYSYLEAGQLMLEPREFALRELVDDLLKRVEVSARKKGLEISVHFEPEVPAQVRGDPNRISQVLLHLFDNGLKFTQQGEVTLRVSLENNLGLPSLVRFEVRDTGCGISAEGCQRLFRPFSQLDSSKTRRYGGLGLGLAVSRLLVERMGGTIGVESDKGSGSTFWFTARLEAVRPVEAPSSRSATAPLPSFPPRAETERRTAPLDSRVVASLRKLQPEDEPNFLTDLVRVYLRETTHLIEEMRQAIRMNDSSRLFFFAERLKSSSANLGARPLAARCSELEAFGRDKKMNGAEEALNRVEKEFEVVRAAMQAEFLSTL